MRVDPALTRVLALGCHSVHPYTDESSLFPNLSVRVNPRLILQLDLSELKVDQKPFGITAVIKNKGDLELCSVLEEIECT